MIHIRFFLKLILKISLLFCSQFFISDGYAQELRDTTKNGDQKSANGAVDKTDAIAWTAVEEPAEFPGGELSLAKYISANIKYPEEAKRKKIQGTVYVSFIVDKEGLVQDPKILRSVDPLLDAEALRLVSIIPQWKPARQNGKPVKIFVSMPIRFSIK